MQTIKYETFTENLEKADVPKLEDKRSSQFLSFLLKDTSLSCFALNIKVRSITLENGKYHVI